MAASSSSTPLSEVTLELFAGEPRTTLWQLGSSQVLSTQPTSSDSLQIKVNSSTEVALRVHPRPRAIGTVSAEAVSWDGGDALIPHAERQFVTVRAAGGLAGS